MKKFLILFIVLLCFSIQSNSQDSIYLLNGKIKKGIHIVQSNDITRIAYKTIGSEKIQTIKKSDVFSYYKNGIEKIIYYQDTMQNNDLTIEEMRKYLKGIQDARNQYTTPLPAIGSGLISFASITQLGPFYGLLPTTFYTIIIGIKTPKVKNADPYLQFDPFYVEGYQSQVKSRKLKQSIFSGIIISGLTATAIWLREAHKK